MRLLTLVSLLGLALSVYACGYGQGDYSWTFIDHISIVFTIESAYYSIAYEYDIWYNAQTSTVQSDMVACSEQFLLLCTQYQKGELTIQTSYSGDSNYLYGLSSIYYGLQYQDSAYISMITTYLDGCGYDTFTYTGTVTPPVPPTTTAEKQEVKAEMMFPFCQYQGYSNSSSFWVELEDCYTGYVERNSWMTQADIDQQNEMCDQITPYYIMNPSQYDPAPTPYVGTTTCSVEQYYEVIGYIFSTEESRQAFAISFYNYFYSCPNAPKEIQWSKIIKDSCLIKTGEVTVTPVSGECGGMEMVTGCVELVYQLIEQQNEQVMWFITVYMQNILEIQPIPSSMTFTGNVEEYTYMFSCIATSGGFATWSVYLEFYNEWISFCAGQTNISWTIVENWIIKFFNICCHHTLPYTTPLPTTELPTTEMLTSEVPTTELPTTEIETTEFPTTVEATTEIGSTASPCVITTPEEECAYILAYFRFIGFLYVNPGWRSALNYKCREHKNRNPNASEKDKAKHFVKSTHECAKDLSYCGSHEHESSHECIQPTGTPYPPPAVTEAPKSGEQPPEGEDSWEYFVTFSIDVFLVGNWELLGEAACAMAQYQHTFPTDATFTSSAASGEEPTVSPSCDEIKSPSGIFIFFEIIAVECGFETTVWWSQWIIKFRAIFLSLDWDCGCWGTYVWSWSVDWIELIFEFLEAMCCGCAPTTPPLPTPPPNGSWDIFRFFISFCSNEEYKVKFECFMSWYFELKGYTQFETMSYTEVYECVELFIEYMVICVDNPTTPKKPKPASLYITYDTFIYTVMYYVSYEGDEKFCNMVSEKNEKCHDKASGESHESSRSGEVPSEPGVDMCEFNIKYMAICHGVWNSGSEWSAYWTQWQQAWAVIVTLPADQQWQQASYACDNAIQTISGWAGPWATEEPSTAAP
jgi:hypothetical protein